jgi:hypothetical protein
MTSIKAFAAFDYLWHDDRVNMPVLASQLALKGSRLMSNGSQFLAISPGERAARYSCFCAQRRMLHSHATGNDIGSR